MPSVWDWVDRFYYTTDDEGLGLYRKFLDGMDQLDHDPDLAIAILNQVRQMAKEKGLDWWVQLATHWELQALLHYKQDYSNVIEIAAQAAVEVRKPQYTELPQRVCLHEDLISAYCGRDPLGYKDIIQGAIDYMQSQVKPGIDCYLCLQSLRIDFLMLMEKYDEAKRINLEFLEASQGEDYHLGSAYRLLCQIAYVQEDWTSLENWATLGIQTAQKTRSSSAPAQLAEVQMWRALYEQKTGDKDQAVTLYKQAVMTAESYPPGVYDGYYDAAAAFFELGNQLDQALTLRETQYTKVSKESRYYMEIRCLLEIIRLKHSLSLPKDELIQQAEAVIRKLKDPTPILKRLDTYR